MELSTAEEKYLKAILILSGGPDRNVSTNAIASRLQTAAASVTDMLKKLSTKELIKYERYKGASLTPEGLRIATFQIRKNRLWEVFLVRTLGMSWDEIHEIAEELEHVSSDRLTELLDTFLGNPKYDPHGDPIPNTNGKYTLRAQISLSELQTGQDGLVVGVKDDEPSFLRHLSEKNLTPGVAFKVLSNDAYDQTMRLIVDGKDINLSGLAARNILVKLS